MKNLIIHISKEISFKIINGAFNGIQSTAPILEILKFVFGF